MTNRREMLEELVRRSRSDSAFFHQLVFQPEEVLGMLDFLGRREKGMILTIAPEDVIAGLAGLAVNPASGVAECGDTCPGTCTATCDCTITCQETCVVTCQATAKIEFGGDDVTGQLRPARAGKRWLFRPFRRPATED